MFREAVIMFGPPGSGKGFIGDHIAPRYGFFRIATGDLMRGKYAQLIAVDTSTMASGGILADEKPTFIVKNELATAPALPYLKLDGYPRSLGQVKILREDIFPNYVEGQISILHLDFSRERCLKNICEIRAAQEKRCDDADIAKVNHRLDQYFKGYGPPVLADLRRTYEYIRIEEVEPHSVIEAVTNAICGRFECVAV